MPLGRSLLLHTTTLKTGIVHSLDIKYVRVNRVARSLARPNVLNGVHQQPACRLEQHLQLRAGSSDIDEELQQPPPDDLGSLFRDVAALQKLCDDALVAPWLGAPVVPTAKPTSPARDNPPINPLEIHRPRMPARSPYDDPNYGGPFGHVGRGDLDPFAPPGYATALLATALALDGMSLDGPCVLTALARL